jgi:penicillin-binding protein 1A
VSVQKAKKVLNIIGKGIGVFILVSLLALSIGIGYVAHKYKPKLDAYAKSMYTYLSSIDNTTFKKLENTVVYDSTGKVIGKANNGNYIYTPIAEISPYIQNGYVSVEDRNFYYHSGIDFKALMRASVALVKNNGEVTQGGSTITQQVLKNNMLQDLGKFERKLAEVYLAIQLEKKYSKADIMEIYCNTNYYQNNCYGVGMACKYYFGKSAKDVSIAESALIVGLSNNPSKYNPVKHPKEALEKRHRVLEDMLENKAISQEEFEKADKEPLNLVLYREPNERVNYQTSFALYCATLKLMELDNFNFQYVFNSKDEQKAYEQSYEKEYAKCSTQLRAGGYKVYTSLDSNQQKLLQGYVDKAMSPFKELSDDGRYAMQGSATVVDNSTGYVTAVVGGRGTEDEYNRAFQSYRQPGSCIKPIVAYGPAFDLGEYSPSTMVTDVKTKASPKNWDAVYRGKVSVREALERSINVPAFNVMQEVRPKNAIQYLAKMRFTGLSYLDTNNGSLAIGGFTQGTTTYEMAKAYSTLVTGGKYSDRNCIKKLECNGKTVYGGTQKTEQVYSEDTAYMLIDCLKGVINKPYATGTQAKIEGVYQAGKTGTTNSNKDGWFCGMTPDYSISVWAGYDIPRPVASMGGGKYPCEVYKNMMTSLMKGKTPVDFTRPSTVVTANIDGNGNRTSRATGKTDLFSNQAEAKKEAKAKELEEQRVKYEEENRQKAEDEKIKIYEAQIKTMEETEISKLDEIEPLDDEYSYLMGHIAELKDITAKQSLTARLQLAYYKINFKIGGLRVIAEEKEAKVKREEQLSKKKLKEDSLEQANRALKELEGWKTDPHADTTMLLKNAKKAMDLCKGYTEYSTLKSRYNVCNTAIQNKVASDSSRLKASERALADARREQEIAENERKTAEQKLLAEQKKQEAKKKQDELKEIQDLESTTTTTTTNINNTNKTDTRTEPTTATMTNTKGKVA